MNYAAKLEFSSRRIYVSRGNSAEHFDSCQVRNKSKRVHVSNITPGMEIYYYSTFLCYTVASLKRHVPLLVAAFATAVLCSSIYWKLLLGPFCPLQLNKWWKSRDENANLFSSQGEIPGDSHTVFYDNWKDFEEISKWNSNYVFTKKVVELSEHADIIHVCSFTSINLLLYAKI